MVRLYEINKRESLTEQLRVVVTAVVEREIGLGAMYWVQVVPGCHS
jgi:hypothetical protein